MARQPSSASEWTTTVEAAVEAELLRRSRRLTWAIVLSLVVGAVAVALAVALRGVSWTDLDARIAERLSPLGARQDAQARDQQALAAEIVRLEGEIRRIDAALRADPEPDPALKALQQQMRRMERSLRAAAEDRQRLDFRLDNWYAEQAATGRWGTVEPTDPADPADPGTPAASAPAR